MGQLIRGLSVEERGDLAPSEATLGTNETRSSAEMRQSDPSGWLQHVEYDLLPLESTQRISDELELYRRAMSLGDSSPVDLKRARDKIPNLERKLRLAAERDELVTERPEGCWCLGLGGRDRRYLVIPGEDDFAHWDTYCSCPEGKAAFAAEVDANKRSRTKLHSARLSRMLRQARLGKYEGKSFESYIELVEAELGELPDANRQNLDLLRGWCADPARNWLLIHGPQGTCKTGLMSVCLELVMDEYPNAILTTVGDLLEQVEATFGVRPGGDMPTTADVLWGYRETGLLVIDDLGNENDRTSAFARSTLFGLVNDRYRAGDKVTAFTSNLDPSGIKAKLGESLGARIIEDCTIVDMTCGPNVREL